MTAAYTSRALADDLRALGLRSGDVVLVHSSLRRIGPTAQGAATVVEALRAAVGAEGTIVVPTFTAANSLSSRTHRERVQGMTAEEIDAFRQAMPGFDATTTPSTGMGAVAELVRRTPGARRSTHPQTSLAAVGPLAEAITRDHPLDCLLGEASPLGLLYRLGTRVLLLGVGFESCTAFHLGEYRSPDPPVRRYDCVVTDGRQADGQPGRRWLSFEDVALDDRDFGRLGAWLERQRTDTGRGVVRRGRVGAGIARLLPMAHSVDLAVEWFKEHRTAGGGSAGDRIPFIRPPG
ncbi:aminoglycoside N(3)-acetyltransferase [Streptomyces cyaneus]|uniref:aminoglycoside N(3)-acetyltransferase n=1 Tax=Streptomyces cyaneus TaxID=1904 RepID=UPI000FF8A81A|nr:AAC(3) family N-acetyltransferase [Streptomyces cyaneus]